MNYLSLFSGVGGFELGIQRAFNIKHASVGTKSEQKERAQGRVGAADSSIQLRSGDRATPLCIGYSEIDKFAIATYEHNWKGHKNYGDTTTINTAELPDFDLLVGGFPCQAFSIAGKRKGFDDTRGTLFFDVARICRDKRPRHLVLENVKGLLNHDGGKTFTTILGVLTDLGYDVEWQVLNAKDFGVPQNRERIFIIGHLRGECGRKILPIRERSSGTNQSDAKQGAQTNIARTVDTRTGSYPKFGQYIRPVLTPDRRVKRQNGRRFKEDGEPSFTLNTQDRHGIYDGTKIRRLTPVECERLMSWPDNWTIGSDAQRYKQCGNGVVSNVVEAVIEKLKPCLLEERDKLSKEDE